MRVQLKRKEKIRVVTVTCSEEENLRQLIIEKINGVIGWFMYLCMAR